MSTKKKKTTASAIKVKRNICLYKDGAFNIRIEVGLELRQAMLVRKRAAELLNSAHILSSTPRGAYAKTKLVDRDDRDRSSAGVPEILYVAREELSLRIAADELLVKLVEYPRKVDMSTYERALASFPALAAAALEDSQYAVYNILRYAVEYAGNVEQEEPEEI